MSWIGENGVLVLLLAAFLARSAGGRIGSSIAGLCHILAAVVCPAYIFWKAYVDYVPDSFLWWCRVAFGFLISAMFAVGLSKSLEKAGNTQADVEQHKNI